MVIADLNYQIIHMHKKWKISHNSLFNDFQKNLVCIVESGIRQFFEILLAHLRSGSRYSLTFLTGKRTKDISLNSNNYVYFHFNLKRKTHFYNYK